MLAKRRCYCWRDERRRFSSSKIMLQHENCIIFSIVQKESNTNESDSLQRDLASISSMKSSTGLTVCHSISPSLTVRIVVLASFLSLHWFVLCFVYVFPLNSFSFWSHPVFLLFLSLSLIRSTIYACRVWGWMQETGNDWPCMCCLRSTTCRRFIALTFLFKSFFKLITHSLLHKFPFYTFYCT